MKGLSDLVDRIRAAGDTTASHIADKTGSSRLRRWADSGRLGRILLIVAALVIVAFLFGCAAPQQKSATLCADGVVTVANHGQIFVVALPCRVIGSYEDE